ncbi:MAG: PDZ domain-containing protein [Myxococcota bacterium]
MRAAQAGWLGGLIGGALGVVLGLALGGDPEPAAPAVAPPRAPEGAAQAPAPPPPPSDDRADDVERLSAEVERLREELAQLDAETDAIVTEQMEEEPDGFDEDALLLAGWLPADVDRLREAYETHELDRLYLKDEARRDGWFRTGRYRRELRALEDDFRAEVGDEDYDAALHAAGRNNRVIVLKVLANSAAQEAGVQAGDEIRSYAGVRIFDPFRLVLLSAQGRLGELVELRVVRGGRELRFFLPRGPLGLRLRQASRPPDS